MKYCNQCGSKGLYRIPPDDDRARFICDNYQTVHYQNPKLVVGCIALWEDRLLMCRRAIQPRYGKWTLPAGFLEIGETVEEGAMRETYEEAGAKVVSLKPYALYNLSFIGQVYLIFLSRLVDLNFRVGYESLEVRLLEEREIAWDELAFSVIREVLQLYFKDASTGIFNFHLGDITPEMNQKFLEGLANMEDQHEKIFTEMRTTLTEKDKDPKVFDPYDEVSQYLAAMADTMGGEGKPSVAAALTGDETLEEILLIAVGLEKDSILFYLGIKDLVPTRSGQDRIDEIIKEERRHVVQLTRVLEKLKTK